MTTVSHLPRKPEIGKGYAATVLREALIADRYLGGAGRTLVSVRPLPARLELVEMAAAG